MRPPIPTWLLIVLIILIPLLSFDNYFAYHAPGAIGSSIESFFNLNEEDLASLFTIYSAPNIILVFLGGMFMDKYGLVRTSLVFNLCMLIGMIVFASAPRDTAWTMTYLLIGRFLLGVGGECICVCASAMIARWFKRSSLTFALGFHSAAVQVLGSAPAFVLLPFLLGSDGMNRLTPEETTESTAGTAAPPPDPSTTIGNVRLCLWFIVIICSISFVANIIYGLLEVRYGNIYIASELEEEFEREMDQDMMRLEMKQQQQTKPQTSPGRSRSTQDGKYSIVQSNDVTPIHVRETNDNVLIDNNTVQTDGETHPTPLSSNPSSPNGDQHPVGGEHHGLLNGSIANLRSLWIHTVQDSSRSFSLWKPWATVRALPTLFWLVVVMQCLLSPILYSFSAFGPLFFMEKYHYTQEEAGFLTSILYLAIILAPFVGFGIDRLGYRCIIQTIAALLIPTMFILLHLTHITPYLIMCGLGIAFAITESNGLAMIAEVCPSDLLGTSYGILGCCTSFFLLFEPYIVGYIHLHTQHYYWSTILFIIITSIGWFATFIIYVYDVNHDNLMTQSSCRKRESETAIELSEQNPAYPELEIVFDQDEEEEDEVQLFSLDEVEAMNELR